MKHLLLAVAVVVALAVPEPGLARGHGPRRIHGSSSQRSSSVHVRGHTTKRGSEVPAYYRSAPDRTKQNNWSTRGNRNPYTGKEGTKRP